MSSLLLVPKDLLRITIEYIARFNMVSIYGITVYPLDWFLISLECLITIYVQIIVGIEQFSQQGGHNRKLVRSQIHSTQTYLMQLLCSINGAVIG